MAKKEQAPPSKYFPKSEPHASTAEKPTLGDLKTKPLNLSAYQRFVARQVAKEQALQRVSQREQLISRIASRLDALQYYLSDDEVWYRKMEDAKLKDLVAAEQDYVQILQTLTGHATQIIGVQHQQKLDQVLPALVKALAQRGLTIPTPTPVQIPEKDIPVC